MASCTHIAKPPGSSTSQPPLTRVVVQGFGNVGYWAARIITDLGCKLIAVSNTSGAIHSDAGIDPDALRGHLHEGGKLVDYPNASSGVEAIAADELIALDCEVLIPAALGGAIHASNAGAVRARMVIEGANNPTSWTADEILNENGVLVIPDVLANAGGVLVSYFEWAQNLQHFSWDEHEVNERLEARMRRAYGQVSERARAGHTSMRVAAYELGISRVVEAGRLRRHRGYV